jgi:hypothetical protein
VHIAHRPAHPQAHQHDLVAEGLCREGECGSSDRNVMRLAIQEVTPRLRVVATGSPEGASDRIPCAWHTGEVTNTQDRV